MGRIKIKKIMNIANKVEYSKFCLHFMILSYHAVAPYEQYILSFKYLKRDIRAELKRRKAINIIDDVLFQLEKWYVSPLKVFEYDAPEYGFMIKIEIDNNTIED